MPMPLALTCTMGKNAQETASEDSSSGGGGDSYPQEEWPVGYMWWYVTGWGKNFEGDSFAYSGAAGG